MGVHTVLSLAAVVDCTEQYTVDVGVKGGCYLLLLTVSLRMLCIVCMACGLEGVCLCKASTIGDMNTVVLSNTYGCSCPVATHKKTMSCIVHV